MSHLTPGIIRRLDTVVVNRIAAGEVIQRPANALKELMENCLDAGATNIQIIIRAGGLKLLQIQDDGCGIRKEDLPIVCERFTTSKLSTFEDLRTIQTYGFRGEALASISHVAHLSILTKTRGSPCAYRAEYMNGKLAINNSTNPKPCAGNQGTTIIVEDLFYNVEQRRRIIKNPTEEYNRILEIITRYSIHNAKVGFSVKKFGETNNDFTTPSNSTVVDNIRVLFGVKIARELVAVNCQSDASFYKMSGYISNGNYSMKKSTFILFINHRLVDCSSLKKVLDGIYSPYLPKGSHPFVYLALEIEPGHIDVNVHPTKHEVHFLHEDIITAEIGDAIDKVLQGSNQSRTFYVQSLLPGAATTTFANTTRQRSSNEELANSRKDNSTAINLPPQRVVRTDPKEQTLDKFLTRAQTTTASQLPEFGVAGVSSITKNTYTTERRDIRLESVKQLREEIETDAHSELISTFRNHTFVGCVDRTRALIQHGTKLIMVNTVMLTKELFYQKMIFHFGNLGTINFDDPISIRDLIKVALNENTVDEIQDIEVEESIADITNFLLTKTPMLGDYFSLRINADGFLLGVPMLLDNYIPALELLPFYLLNLAKRVEWESEVNCFKSFCRETANFYAIPPGTDEDNEEEMLTGKTWKWTIEHVIFSELKRCLIPSKAMSDDSSIIELADLPSLYKVFERC